METKLKEAQVDCKHSGGACQGSGWHRLHGNGCLSFDKLLDVLAKQLHSSAFWKCSLEGHDLQALAMLPAAYKSACSFW